MELFLLFVTLAEAGIIAGLIIKLAHKKKNIGRECA